MIAGAWLCLAGAARGRARDHVGRHAHLAPLGRLALDRERLRRLRGRRVVVLRPTRARQRACASLSTAWTWLQSGSFKVGLEILVDPLSTFMMLIVAGVGGLIVLYSIGYMDGDDEERRYFAYMSFFVFSMLLLVQAGNLLILLVGWGLVGSRSYLLIGFWHERPSAVAAAKKAFIMNAVGDATMALAFFVLIVHAGSLEFAPRSRRRCTSPRRRPT